MNHLYVDIETKSSIDIKTAGAYKYAMSDDFEILLIAYKWNDTPTVVWDLPQLKKDGAMSALHQFKAWLTDPDVVKHAFNASFEWWCLNREGYVTPIDQWHDTMAHSLYCGYAAGLSAAGNAIGLPQDSKKMTAGKALIKYFCQPCKPTKTNGGREWNLPRHAPEKWELFKQYNEQDVEAEYSIQQRLDRFPMPEEEVRLWQLDTYMNAYGVRCDRQLVEGALYIDAESNEELMQEARNLTGLSNPNSNVQLQGWLNKQGLALYDLQKETVSKALEEDLPDDVRRVLQIRQQLGKTSVKKYQAMQSMVCEDDRIRGLLQYYGANRAGRWAGRGVQLQNLTKHRIGTVDIARKLVKDGNIDGVKVLYGNVPDLLSQLVRTAIIPSDGHKFVVADFSAIEARVIAWLAGETWVNEVFATHGKIYEATAAQMFHVPIETIKKGAENYDLRQKGKVATLALGYQGGTSALKAMGALKMGIAEEDLQDIVNRWRSANRAIVGLWNEAETAAVDTVTCGERNIIKAGKVEFALEGDIFYGQTFMTIRLPSGRKLYYARPGIEENRFGKEAVCYNEIGATNKWETTTTYGGKLVENLCQAIARDCLAESIRRIHKRGFNIVFHVHDEVVIDAPMDVSVDEVCEIMSEPIPWAPGLVLKAAGFESDYYMKD